MGHGRPTLFAAAIGAFHGLLLALFQVENIFLRSPAPSIVNLGDLLALQWQIGFGALLFAIAASAFAGSHRGRSGTAIITSIVALYSALNQLYFHANTRHFRLSTLEGWEASSTAIASSAVHAIDAWFLFHLGLVGLALFGLLAWSKAIAAPATSRAADKAISLRMLLVATGLLGAGWLVPPAKWTASELVMHPFVALVDDGATPLLVPQNATAIEPIPDHDAALAKTVADMAGSAGTPPNIVLVVLESVGALQLFGQGEPWLADHMPNLARLTRHGVTFEHVYSVFPGTVRTHVALNTGGSTLSWGNVFYDFDFPYTGPTLARTFNDAGYATAVFSSQRLDFENMDGFYSRSGYGTVMDSSQPSNPLTDAAPLNSWGVREESTVAAIDDWIAQRDSIQPFFINYLTVATHHPYDWPPDLPGTTATATNKERYANALRYTDHALGQLATVLQQRGVLENTVIAITGDHGQAFGDIHGGNYLHKNFLYEENIRSFLLIAKLDGVERNLRSQRIATTGDVMPTLLGLAGMPSPVPGQDLAQENFAQRPVMFYKNAHPLTWGLRYGPWKFIEEAAGRQPQLFDLTRDPAEQTNLAEVNGEWVPRFRAALANWYFALNDHFTARLAGYTPPNDRPLRRHELATSGPKLLRAGYPQATQKSPRFHAAERMHPDELVLVWAYWIPSDTPENYSLTWHSPSGERWTYDYVLDAGWTISQAGFEGPLPMAAGQWRVELNKPGAPALTTEFFIEPQASLKYPALAPPVVTHCAVGTVTPGDGPVSDRFATASRLTKDQRPAVFNRWQTLLRPKTIEYHWYPPEGEPLVDALRAEQGWNKTWWVYDRALPLAGGEWRVEIIDKDSRETMCSLEFRADP